MSKRVRYERYWSDTAPPVGHLRLGLSNRTPISRGSSKLGMVCPMCGLHFERYAAWVRKADTSYCSRACKIEGQKVRVETHCVTCGVAMERTPSDAPRTITCSKRCSSLRRRSARPDPRATTAYKDAVRQVALRSVCKECGVGHGPWVVRGVVATWGTDDLARVDTSTAELWCKQCHLTDVAPLGAPVRDARRAGIIV